MAYDKKVDGVQLDADLTSVANAIRTKGGTSAQLAFPAGFVSAVQAIPTGGTPCFELIGEATLALAEYTDTDNFEETAANINVGSTDYAYGLVVITCDAAITTATEWGMSVVLFGRRTSNNTLLPGAALMQKGAATLLFSAMPQPTTNSSAYGVSIKPDVTGIILRRKANTNMPKMRAGNYHICVYGLKSL